MTRKIFQSIIAVVISVLLLSLALITGVLYNHFETTMLDQLRTTAQFAEQGVEQEGMAYFDSLHAQNCRVTWIAADGTVKYDNRSNPKTMENHADRQEGAGRQWRTIPAPVSGVRPPCRNTPCTTPSG